jgi:nitrite reductase (NO-forming)
MTRPFTIMLVLAALALGGLGACSSGSSAKCPAKVATRTATAGAVKVCGSEIKFDVTTIKAQPGPLEVTFVNGGTAYHTLKIKNTSLELKANAGKTVSGTVTLAKGTYDFECTVAGHAAAGMKGTIEVG